MITKAVGEGSKYMNTGNAQKLVLDIYDENSDARKELKDIGLLGMQPILDNHYIK